MSGWKRQWLYSFLVPLSFNKEFLLLHNSCPASWLSVYHNPNCVPIIYINVMLPCLSRMTREAARFQQGVGWRGGEGWAELILRDQAPDSRKTGRGFHDDRKDDKGLGSGWRGGSARDGREPLWCWRSTQLEEAAAGAGLGSMVRTGLKITYWTRRTDHQIPPFNSMPIISFSKHLINTNL